MSPRSIAGSAPPHRGDQAVGGDHGQRRHAPAAGQRARAGVRRRRALAAALGDLRRRRRPAHPLLPRRATPPPKDWPAADAEDLHELRKWVVIHRYQIDIVEPLWPRFVKMWSGEAQRLRDRLGKHQDLLMLASLTGPHQPLALALASRPRDRRTKGGACGRGAARRPAPGREARHLPPFMRSSAGVPARPPVRGSRAWPSLHRW